MDPRAPPPLGMAPHLSSSHLRPPEPPHRLLLRPTSFLEQQPSIKGEYIEDLEGIKFEPAEPPRSPEHVSRQQFLKQFPLISVRPPSPSPLPLPTLIPVSQQPLRFPPGLFPGHQVQYYYIGHYKSNSSQLQMFPSRCRQCQALWVLDFPRTSRLFSPCKPLFTPSRLGTREREEVGQQQNIQRNTNSIQRSLLTRNLSQPICQQTN